MRKVSILLTLFIFGMITRAWCDPVKSTIGATIQLTTVKVGENRALVETRTEPAKESIEWMKRSQARLRDVNFLRTPEEKKKSQWAESSDKVITSRELLENIWRNKLPSPLQTRESNSSSSHSGPSFLKPYPDPNGSLEEGKLLTILKLLQSRQETFKEIFMGIRFSFDLRDRRVFLEMNVAPSMDKSSGFAVRF